MVVNRRVHKERLILNLSPVAPPYGGLANQTKLITASDALSSMRVDVLRTNPSRKTEKPGSISRLFSFWPIQLHSRVVGQLRAHRPCVVFLRANGDISFLRNAAIAVLAAKKAKAKLVIHLHASRRGFWHSRKVGSIEKRSRVKKLLEKLGYAVVNAFLKKADAFSQLTTEIDSYYQSVGLRAATHIIPNAVPLRTETCHTESENRILFVGRLTREKGFFDLLNALESIEEGNWNLDVLGSPVSEKDAAHIEQLLRKHRHTKNIHLNGTVRGDEKWSFFDNASFLVLPTHLEVFPNVILEAMASGLAVISTPVGEIRNMLPSDGGKLVDPGDVRALSTAVKTFLENPDQVQQMGEVNLEKVKEYDLEHVAGKFRDMILSTLNTEKDQLCQ